MSEDGSSDTPDTVDALERLGKAVEQRRARDRGAKVFSILFVAAFVGFLFGGMILLVCGFYIAGGIVFACAPAMVLISIIVTSIHNRLSTKGYDIGFAEVGTVVSCELKTNPYGSPELARYEVWVEINDDKFYAEADRRYEKGERVKLRVKNNYRDITVEGPTEYSLERGRVKKERLGMPSGERAFVMREVELAFADPEEDMKKTELKSFSARLAEVKNSKLSKEEKMRAYGAIINEYKNTRDIDEHLENLTEEQKAEATEALAKRIKEISQSGKTDKEKFAARRAAVRDWHDGKTSATEPAEEKAEELPHAAAPMPVPDEPIEQNAEAKEQVKDLSSAEAEEEKTTEPKEKTPSRRKTSVAYKGINRKR